MKNGRVLAFALLAASTVCADAADLGVGVLRSVPAEGVPCAAPVVAAFPSVWLGHFSGGMSFYPGAGESIALDWRDEKLCFPSSGACNRYMSVMRRRFHRPEGWFTCLPIR